MMEQEEGRRVVISIHALLAESDARCIVLVAHNWVISIHALLAESDSAQGSIFPQTSYFNPRSPCGERHMLEEAGL